MDYTNDRTLKRCFNEEIVREIQSDVSKQHALDAEFEKLTEDREIIRTIFPTGDNKVLKIIYFPRLYISLFCVCVIVV